MGGRFSVESQNNMSDEDYIKRLLNDTLGKLSFHGETYADKEVLKRLDIYEFTLNHVYGQLEKLLSSCFGRKEFSAVDLFNKTHQILKEHKENLLLELKAIDCEMGVLGLDYIEEYLLDHMGSDFAVSCGIKVFGGFEYWARFEEPDDENESYKHFVQAKGGSLEEVVRKIAAYIDSGKTYNDGRYV